ncbi:MAG TPA: fluoride efflux transporter CrcB [Mycobacteriales bacterium]|jgi:CrcB protein|nr:fluoride efflux transporter CrcB [Mycobacteriales bacterium]
MPDGSTTGPDSATTDRLPIDPDQPSTGLRRDLAALRSRWDVLAAVAFGGMTGATARYALSVALPTRSGRFPWGTFLTNVTGCLILGVLLVVLTERFAGHRYLRPFLGTGMIGAYTTFSTYAVEADLLVRDGHSGTAAAYVLLSLVVGLGAVWLGMRVGRAATKATKKSAG